MLATDQDMGLDVVGWKDAPDQHNNLLQIYAQCATGEGWLEDKIGEPNIEMWSGILLVGLDPNHRISSTVRGITRWHLAEAYGRQAAIGSSADCGCPQWRAT